MQKCKSCGKSIMKNRFGPAKQFCGRACKMSFYLNSGAVGMKECACRVCGKVFRDYERKRGVQKYCSRACFRKGIVGRRPWNKKPVLFCIRCGNELIRPQTRFCSRNCWKAWGEAERVIKRALKKLGGRKD